MNSQITPTEDLLDILEAQGYSDFRRLDNGIVCGLMRFNFTWGLMVGIDERGYERRYCYEHRHDAKLALDLWDGSEHPSRPWIKLKGTFNGEGVDLLNPTLID